MAPRENPIHCEQPKAMQYSDQKERTRYGIDSRMDTLRASQRGQLALKLESYMPRIDSSSILDNKDFIQTFQKGLVTLGFLTKTDGICGPDMTGVIKEFQKNRGILRTGTPDKKTVETLIRTLDYRRTRHGQIIDIPLTKPKTLRNATGKDHAVSFLVWGDLDKHGNADKLTVQDSYGNLQQGKFRNSKLIDGTIFMSNGSTFVGREYSGNSAFLDGKLFYADGMRFEGYLSRKDTFPYIGRVFSKDGRIIGNYSRGSYIPIKK